MPAVQHVLVVVPARDEQELLPGCLDALAVAVGALAVPATVVVALDRCTDATADVVAGRPGVVGLRTQVGSAGGARRHGVRHGLRRLAQADPAPPWSSVWLASTDADSQVPPSWLHDQVELADAGVDLLLGTVDLAPEHVDPVATAWRRDYADRLRPGGGHPHVHGANLGVRASRYLAAGGFPRVRSHEDVALSRSVARLPGAVVVTTSSGPVLTSARRHGRAPEGVGADLRRLAGHPRGAGPLRVAGPLDPGYSWGDDGAGGAGAVPVPATG
ncbi:glycosyltransferase family 2 protein [Angustibacter peucedani]